MIPALELKTLGDCAQFFSGGTPSKGNPDFWDGEMPWVSCKDMKVPRLYDAEDHLSEEGAKNGTRLVPPQTILIVVRGMILAKEFPVAMAMREVAFNQDLKALHCNDEVDSWFLYYWLRANAYEILGLVDEAAHGTKRLQSDRLLGLEVKLPHLKIQRKIASILSAYDDLIENNTRRIKILEEMARMIYREWFVNFRFPGHEQVKLIDSPLGMIPEGWEVKAVQDTFEILGGGTPSTKEPVYWDAGTVNWYSPTDLTSKRTMFMDESATKITQLGLQKSSARLFPVFSVMMTSRATLGVIAINTTEACTNQGFITCIPNERFPLYTLYFWLRENVDQFISLASGATFKEITKGVFKTIELAVPPAEVVCRFEEIVGSIGKQLLNLQRKNQNLRQTRDLLLPKLISGEVAV